MTRISIGSLFTLAQLYKQVLDYGHKVEVYSNNPYILRTYKERKSFFGLLTTKIYYNSYHFDGDSIIRLRIVYQ